MNTERPDHDDEPRPVSGDAPDTEGARPRTTSPSEAAGSGTDAVETRGPATGDAEGSGTSGPAGDAGASGGVGASGEHGPAEGAGAGGSGAGAGEYGAGAGAEGPMRAGESGTADRPREQEGGPSEARAGGIADGRPSAGPGETAAGVHRTGTEGTGTEGTGPKAADADAPAPSRPTKPDATGPRDADAPLTGEAEAAQAATAGTTDPAAAGDDTSAPAGAPATAANTPASPAASPPGTTNPAAAGDEPAPADPPPTAANTPASPAASPPGTTDPAAAGDDTSAPAGAPAGTGAAESSVPSAGDDHADAGPEPVVGGSRDADRGSEGPARRRTPALVASVAAAVLLVGGGGAYLAAGAAGDSGGGATPGANGDATPPPLALDGYSESGPNGIAPGEPNPYGATYRAEGALPDGPDAAPVFHARGQVTEDRVVALAEALGVEGRPVAEGGSWRIGGQDGSGPTLRVDKQAPGTWTFSRNIRGSDNCKGATCKAPTGAKTAAVSEEAAKKAAAPVLKAVGQDDAKLDASQVLDGSRVVNADPEVGGLPTYGWTTGVVVGASGEVVGGSGRLAEPVKGDEYPVVSAREALDAMNGAPGAGDRVEIGGCATPAPLDEGQQQEEPCAPAKPAGETVAVDEAVFGLAAHSVDGRPALVPSWLFEVRPAGSDNPFTVTHPAVETEFLAAPTGSGERPGEEPSGPGDEPTSAPATRDVEVEGYTAQGDELTVVFTGGVCADYEATASESDGKVTVRVTETPWPDKVCILIAKQYEQTLRLDAPLGDRQVVTADGEPVPLYKDGARLPAPTGAR
ncbi:hypothetical protein [Streptomyces sp. EMB24]|uniref:hypothetical protein n=1 Tax=Streptomyces sp. EMB24 TaxID=2835531 RepID=UPI002DD41D68|nr:hypothetical protein [Streptomyces sp. EMB24]